MYYQERSFDSDWLILLLAVVILIASIMYNPFEPKVIAEGLSRTLAVDAVRGDATATLLLYSPVDSVITFPDYNISAPASAGLHALVIPPAESLRICVRSEEFGECGFIYPRTR